MPRSHAQQVALALGPKFSAGLSVLGSSWIILEVLRDRKKLGLVYHRLLLGLSCLDVLISSAWFLSTWPVPAEVEGLYGNVGNDRTCVAQGFFIQLKAGNPFYNSWLALYFVMVVRYGWTERQLQQLEPFFHSVAVTMAVGTSSASAALGLFGNANLWCWIEGVYPLHRMLFFYIWYWISFVVVAVSMIAVVTTVRAQERASLRFSANKSAKNSKKVATQAVLYIGGYFLTALFSTIVRVWQAFAPGAVPFWAILGMTIFYPMQGLFNFCIYIRPRYIRYRKRHPEWSLWTTLQATLMRAIRGAAGDLSSSLRGSSTTRVSTSDDDFKLGTPFEQDELPEDLGKDIPLDDDVEQQQQGQQETFQNEERVVSVGVPSFADESEEQDAIDPEEFREHNINTTMSVSSFAGDDHEESLERDNHDHVVGDGMVAREPSFEDEAEDEREDEVQDVRYI